MRNLFFLLLMAGMTTLISCTKEGQRGPAGLDGQDGTNGTNGQNGNANVKSLTIDILESQWTDEGPGIAQLELDAPILTEEIVNNGSVMVYLGTSGFWYALPVVLTLPAGSQSYTFGFEPGKLTVISSITSGAAVKPDLMIRIVTATSEGLVRHPDLDWTNYEDVSRALQLAD